MSLMTRLSLQERLMISPFQYICAEPPPSRLYAALQPRSSISLLNVESRMPSDQPSSRPSTTTKQ